MSGKFLKIIQDLSKEQNNVSRAEEDGEQGARRVVMLRSSWESLLGAM